MASYTQTERPMAVSTPLGTDVLLLKGFSGHEAVSQLFSFHLTLLAENSNSGQVAFDKLLGQSITVKLQLPDESIRHFNGLCSQVSECEQDDVFTTYHMQIVPSLWLLTRQARSRIFQQQSVVDILKKVFANLSQLPEYKLQGTFDTRDYCVQYRETDFNFACRLMEEEGIYYYFKHQDGSHTMVVANTPQGHADLEGASEIVFEAWDGSHLRKEDRICEWEKTQELRSGKYTLWDYNFQLPDSNLEASETIGEPVQIGKVSHKLKVGGNDKLEIYDFPGEYAQRYDGIAPGGGDRSSDTQKIFKDKGRTAKIRMQEEATSSLVIHGTGGCRNFSTGRKFKLKKHFNADGEYVLTSAQHTASQGDYRSETSEFHYENSFACIPSALPFRPIRCTPKPVVQGTQTATVVGPSGEEIFTDKYSRVKVQFHWDREGKKDANSSCWVRVASVWAGNQWGAISIPRVGQEVVVAFEEGDPDQPIIIGSVYNPDQMPPYKLPDNKTQSGVKTRSTLHGGSANFNELRFEDKKGSEDIYFHAEKDFHRYVENDDDLQVYHDQTIMVKNNRTETVKEGDESITIEQGNRTVVVSQGNDSHDIKQGNRSVLIEMGNDSLNIKMGNQSTKLDMGSSTTEAMQSITLKVGESSVVINQMGVTIQGMMISINGQVQTQIQGLMTQITGSAMLQIAGGIIMVG